MRKFQKNEHIVNIHIYDPESEDVIVRLLSQTENKDIGRNKNMASLFYMLEISNITEKSLSSIHGLPYLLANKKNYLVDRQKKPLTLEANNEPLENQNTDIPGVFISKNAIENKKPENGGTTTINRHLLSPFTALKDYSIDLAPTDIKTFALHLFARANFSTVKIIEPNTIFTTTPVLPPKATVTLKIWDPHETHENLSTNMQSEIALVMMISLAGLTAILLAFFKTGKGIHNANNTRHSNGVITIPQNSSFIAKSE